MQSKKKSIEEQIVKWIVSTCCSLYITMPIFFPEKCADNSYWQASLLSTFLSLTIGYIIRRIYNQQEGADN